MINAVTVGDSGSLNLGSSGIDRIPDQLFGWITGSLNQVFGSSDLTDNWSLIGHTLIKILGAIIALHP